MGDIRSAYRLAKRGRGRSRGEASAVVDSLVADCIAMCQSIISDYKLSGIQKKLIRRQIPGLCNRLSFSDFRWRQEISK